MTAGRSGTCVVGPSAPRDASDPTPGRSGTDDRAVHVVQRVGSSSRRSPSGPGK